MDSDTSSTIPPSTSLLRPDSEQKVDLHVYLVPSEVWNDEHKSAVNEVIPETKSLGFVRVWPDLSLFDLRDVMKEELGDDAFPEEFVYLRSVGRCLTQVRGRQELELRAKDFRPPRNYGPEIFLLRSSRDVPDTALIEASKRAEMDRQLALEEEQRQEEAEHAERERIIMEEKGGKSGRPSRKLIPLGNRRKDVDHGGQNLPPIAEKGSGSRLPAKNIVKPMIVSSPVKLPRTIESKKTGGKTGGKSKPAGSMTMNELKALQHKGGPPTRKPRAAPKRLSGGAALSPRIANKANKKATSDGSGLENADTLTPKGRGTCLGKIQMGQSVRGKNKVGSKVKGRDHLGGASVGTRAVKPQGNVPGERQWEEPALRDTDREVLHKLRQRPKLKAQRHKNPAPTNGTLPSEHNTLPNNYPYPHMNSQHSKSSFHPDAPNLPLIHQSSSPHTNPSNTPGPQPSHQLSLLYAPRTPGTHEGDRVLSKHSSQPLPQRSHSKVTVPSQQGRSLPTTSDSSRNQLRQSRSVSISLGRRTGDPSTQPSSSQYSQISTVTLPEMPWESVLSGSPQYTAQGNDPSPEIQTGIYSQIMESQGGGSDANLPLSNAWDTQSRQPHAQERSKSLTSNSPLPGPSTDHHLDPRSSPDFNNSDVTNNGSTFSQVIPSPAAPPHPTPHADPHPQGSQDYPATLNSPRKGGQRREITTNSDSGIGGNTPEESQNRVRGDVEEYRSQPHPMDRDVRPHPQQGVDPRPYMGPHQGQYKGPGQYDQEPLHRPYGQHQSQQQQYRQQKQNVHPVRTRGPADYPMGPPSHQLGPTAQGGGYERTTGTQNDHSAIQQPGRAGFQENSQRTLQQHSGPYQREDDRASGQQRLGPHGGYHGEEEGHRYGPRELDQDSRPAALTREDTRDGHGTPAEQDMRVHPQEAQRAMEGLQLDKDGGLSPKHYSQGHPCSPEEPSSSQSSRDPAKQQLLNEIKEEQEQRREMEKAREELIKKAKALQGKTMDRRKKDDQDMGDRMDEDPLIGRALSGMRTRDYWKKRYYDEKKKTPSLEEQVSKLTHQVQQQNRKLMSHLEGKGAKAPKGPPSKKMDHKIQIFRHQHDIEEMKRHVDNARMKLATEIKLRTQAETELRILKSEVTQKKISLTLKRGEKNPPGAKTKIPRPAGRTGNSV